MPCSYTIESTIRSAYLEFKEFCAVVCLSSPFCGESMESSDGRREQEVGIGQWIRRRGMRAGTSRRSRAELGRWIWIWRRGRYIEENIVNGMEFISPPHDYYHSMAWQQQIDGHGLFIQLIKASDYVMGTVVVTSGVLSISLSIMSVVAMSLILWN